MKKLKLYLSHLLFVILSTGAAEAQNQNVNNGGTTAPVSFPATGCSYSWVNNTPSIGLAASGSGDIPSFLATNTSTMPIIATVMAIPINRVAYAYINNSGDGTVSVVNTINNTVVGTIAVGQTPIGVAASPDGSRVYIVNEDSNTISVINTSTNTVVATIAVGSNARGGIAVSPDGTKLYLATFGGDKVLVINTTTNSIVASIAVGHLPLGVTMAPDGSKVYVGNFNDGTVSVINTVTNILAPSIIIGSGTAPMAVAISPDGNTLYVAAQAPDKLYIINTATNSIIASIPLGLAVDAMAISADGSRVYVTSQYANTVSVINTITNSLITTIPVSAGPAGISISSDSKLIYVTGPTVVSVISTITNTVTSTFTTGTSPHSYGNFIVNSEGECIGSSITFTITVNPTPNIISTGNLPPLNTQYGTPSVSTSFNVSGTNLNGGVLVTPPVGFEISTDNVIFRNSVNIGISGILNPTPVYIRLTSVTAVGSYSGNIVLNSTGAQNINIAMPVSIVSPAPITITANNNSKTYGSILNNTTGSTAFSITGGSLKNGNTITSVNLIYGIGAAATAPVGRYASVTSVINANGNGFLSSNYNITYNLADIIVTPIPLTIIADNKTKVFGINNPVLTVSYSGFVNSETATVISTLPTIATTATKTSPVGQYTITASGAVSRNYVINYIEGLLTITPLPLPIVIPNTFTPNGDGINDFWNISGLAFYNNVNVSIYNRWGVLLYYSAGYSKPWDGTFKSSKLPVGTYYYVILVDVGKSTKTFSGPIAIIR
jgi:gliding motility-associated-like protein